MERTLGFTYIGGSTAKLEVAGLKLLTDPGFDPAGTEFRSGTYVLQRTAGPFLSVEAVLPADAVLLSHDHHFDNLDASGRRLLPLAKRVLTTHEGADRLGGNAFGLAPWESVRLETNGKCIKVTATPARHGPEGGDRGPVIGFILEDPAHPEEATYVSGDTVWYEGVEEVARRFPVRRAVLFMGAARVEAVGPQHLTMTADEGVAVARAMPKAVIVPLHFEGWTHFSEGREVIEQTFAKAGLLDRLVWGEPGRRIDVP
jgi:L-ascorbate metabolism protein UlaG (beta-lactamase superfamily)